ncbi:MAG: phosphatidate cytidylyltransferase [Acidocella sp.]|nr:phosphatidate cytidylyltransferase [Acidocella sp.]
MAHALSDPAPKAISGRWSDFSVRAASALVLGPIAIFCVWHGGWAWSALLAVAMAGLGWEWGKLAKLAKPVILAALLLVVWGSGLVGGLPAALLAVAVAALTARVFCGSFAAWGVPYAGIGGISLFWLRLRPDVGLMDTLFLVLVVWGTDIGAYLAGRLLGGPKLAPRISPGKTWSGSLGGLFIGALAGELLAGGLLGFSLAAFGVGLLLSLCAQAGDLLESAIKRKLGVKDSGRTIPGHGGLFDRLDGFLAAAPVAALLAFCMHGGIPIWG